MNISDEWETPEKQPFKDFVSICNDSYYSWLLIVHSFIHGVIVQFGKKSVFFHITLENWPPNINKPNTIAKGFSTPLTLYVCLSVQGNMRHWIEDPDCRDQYSVIYEAGERTAIFSNDAKEPITVEERAVSSWTQLEMQSLKSLIRHNSTELVGLQTNNVFVSWCSAGQRRTCAGLLKAPILRHSTNVALLCGVARSSNRFRGSAIRACLSSTSHHARGNQHFCLAALTMCYLIKRFSRCVHIHTSIKCSWGMWIDWFTAWCLHAAVWIPISNC